MAAKPACASLTSPPSPLSHEERGEPHPARFWLPPVAGEGGGEVRGDH